MTLCTLLWILMKTTSIAAFIFMLMQVTIRSQADALSKQYPVPALLQTKKAVAISRFMKTLYERGEFNGAVLVAGRQGIIYHGAFGLANRARHVAFQPDTPSCLASLSKPLTAVAIMMLVKKGSLRYDDPISRYIPELQPHLGNVTVRQLLTHTSGIPDYGNLDVEHPGMSNADVLNALTRVDHLDFPAGERYEYSNSGYVLLSIVVERVTGIPLSAYLHANVFGPLKMTHTFVLTDNAQRTRNVARGYSVFGTLDDYDAFVTGDGGVYSTVDDLYRFDRSLYTDELVPQSLLKVAFTPASVRTGTTMYGFGWNIGQESDGKRVWHTGNTSGFRAFIERRLERHRVVIMLTNVGNSKRVEINEALNRILAGQPFTYPKRSSALALHEVIKVSGVAAAIAKYRAYKLSNSNEYDLSEAELNALGYQVLYGDRKAADAVRIFLLNSQEHPLSSNAFDSLAEAYEVSGNQAASKANYLKALELDPTNLHARTMLTKL